MSVLESIIAGVKLDQATRQLSENDLDGLLKRAPAVRNPLDYLKRDPFSVIAEVKRSSPSKGALAAIPEPQILARTYQDAGANLVSVLTEQRRFGGSLQDFDAVRKEVTLPMLRKDFIVNDYLVRESRAHGADLILLIVAALTDLELVQLYELTATLGMTSLLEVHDEWELDRALALDPEIIGVNARNLHTLEVDLSAFERLIPTIPHHIYKVAESGISTVEEADQARDAGADAILVGEALVRSKDPATLIDVFKKVRR